MFLANLELEKRHLFLDLDIYIAKCDGHFAEEEKAVIQAHCVEMHIDCNNYQTEKSLENALQLVQTTFTTIEKRMTYLELLSVVLADEQYVEAEKVLMKQIESALEISNSGKKMAETALIKLKESYSDMHSFIFSED